ncbi:Type II secretion system protein D precursor [Maioricimonas rarisocia]|uniref:Type II secretion system protein D n=1 Tax=Maioricimonas rarisocia TaxID=2528026 RepID=A0A517ZE50_9PLAN|nr:type II and III secretion system protein family protein [Maioricimonas rarisocia]QDU40735.1 Type II secretion system protein D precursor [Maioricimonas rarisocia]
MPISIRSDRCLAALLMLGALLAWLPQEVRAQSSDDPAAADVQPGEEIFQVLAPASRISIIELETRVLEAPARIRIVDGFDPEILNVTALSPTRIRVRAERPGITTLKLVDEHDRVFKIEVFVEGDVRELQAYINRLFPGSSIEAVRLKEDVVLRGWVTEPDQIPQIIAVAQQFAVNVHNQMQVAGVNLVQLDVRVMEVQRSKLRQLGFNFVLNGQQYFVANSIGSLAPISEAILPFGGPPSINVQQSALANSSINFGITGNNEIFQGFIEALQREALLKILAEPKLVTTSGRPATMHSGGEFPILVPQSLGTVTIEWRDFGVRMEAVPIVLGNGRLRLDIAPEVSERDFSNAVDVDGLVVPGITTRRVNTQVEMKFGETLMIGGLISTRRTGSTEKVPFLGELPWIGALFSRKEYTVGETELVILVTPHMVTALQPGQIPPIGPGQHTDTPLDRELYIDGMLEVPSYGPDCPDCGPGHPEMILPPEGVGLPPAMPPVPADGPGPAPGPYPAPGPGLIPPPPTPAEEAPSPPPSSAMQGDPRTRLNVRSIPPTSTASAETWTMPTSVESSRGTSAPRLITPDRAATSNSPVDAPTPTLTDQFGPE